MKLTITKTTIDRVLHFIMQEDTAGACHEYLKVFFSRRSDEAITTLDMMTGALLRAAVGSTSSVEYACLDEDFSARTLWRAFEQLSLAEIEAYFFGVFHANFHEVAQTLGVLEGGFDVLIDEHQAIFFGRPRTTLTDAKGKETWVVSERDAVLTEVGKMVGTSKHDKYSGRYRALEYQFMVAKFRRSGIILPLDVVLVATGGPLMLDHMQVPDRSRDYILDRFMQSLERYAPPRRIMFDKGYHHNANYRRVADYCDKHPGTVYLTPASRDKGGAIVDAYGTVSGVTKYLESRRTHARPIKPKSTTRFVIAYRDIKDYPGAPRTFIAFYKQKDPHDKLPYDAVPFSKTHYAAGFYTNHPDPSGDIVKWERYYSQRWSIENWFKHRVKHFNNGRGHFVARRVIVFMTGILALSMFGLVRARRVPKYDPALVSRKASVTALSRELVAALDQARARRRGAAAA